MRDKLRNNKQLATGNWQIKILLSFAYFLLFILFSCNSNKKESHQGHANIDKEDSLNIMDKIYYCPMDTEVVQKGPGVCPKCNMDLEPKPTAKIQKSEEYYTCPMHPEVKKDKPGSCPICGMDLIKKTEQTEAAENEYSLIANPVNMAVLSNVKAIKPVSKSMSIRIKSSGYITYDTRRIYNISSRIDGRIENLHIKYAYQPVKAGQVLFEIFSHDLQTAQQEYLYIKTTDPDNADLITASRKKLLLLGMTEAQVNAIKNQGHVHLTTTVYSPYSGYVVEKSPNGNSITSSQGTMTGSSMDDNTSNNIAPNMDGGNQSLLLREGAYVNKGQVVFKVVNTDMVWGIFEIYSSQLPSLKVNQTVHIKIENTDEMIMGKVDFIEPAYKEETGTVRFRVYLPNQNQNLKIGNLLSGEIEAGTRKGLWIPQMTMYDLGRDKIVFVKKEGVYQTRKIVIGAVSGNEIEVISGLAENEEIAESAQFMIDSESFVKVSK
ncbi:MAG: efflux RND transporter periplasmic adaptor subunit [Cytophagaceae bacterium]|nr:efflux RND transporter periplasmic adaptor subunit [Cytophagaceae bacterium]